MTQKPKRSIPPVLWAVITVAAGALILTLLSILAPPPAPEPSPTNSSTQDSAVQTNTSTVRLS
ncbi:hypothetical protein V5R04_15090 [Jonesiaceae bacterium BS-20]|uniref:Uncharacterized protein n=1 Tax=Jonesiaceae bacterium BS-20 TaxID=3120821 RepID=A0AAU7DU75_9MICO